MRAAPFALAALLGIGIGGRARAFSDPLMFSDITQVGGGGGRFFTGSPFDGYTCAVCHRGGVTPSVRVIGFPAQYVPGETYEVELQWTPPELPHALHLELVNKTAQDIHLALEPLDQVSADGRCERVASGEVAATLSERGQRRIIQVRACGARLVRFRFTAPDAPALAFAAVVVRADGSGDAEGDGVLELRRVVKRVGAAEAAYGATEVCSVGVGRRSSGVCGLLVLASMCILACRRYRR